MNPHSKYGRAFTLIELLVVIAIIGILMGLLFPAVNGAMNSARKAQAGNDATQIATACVAYETEYGYGPWCDPSTGEDGHFTEVKGDLLARLMGTNTRKIVFLEVQDVKNTAKGKSGYINGSFQDPWGGIYQIAYDTNYSSSITQAGTNNQRVRRNYAVWSDPSKQKWYTNLRAESRYVQSW